MLLEAKGREVNAGAEHLGLGQNTDTTNTVNLHLHVRVTVGVAQVSKMGSPCRVLGVALDNDSVLVEGIGKLQSCVGLLPRVQIVGLGATEPIGERSPDVGDDNVLVVAH